MLLSTITLHEYLYNVYTATCKFITYVEIRRQKPALHDQQQMNQRMS